MLIVETYIDFSEGKGIGLFSNVKIEKGSIYWVRNEIFDKIISQANLDSLNPLASDYIKTFGVLETFENWYLCCDNARFTNHSKNPNTLNHFDKNGLMQYCTVLKNIEVGEEILCDYTKTCLTCINGVNFKEVY